jgi:hypothetical protein
MATDDTFSQRCLRATQTDVELCWEDYIDLMNKGWDNESFVEQPFDQ